MKIKNTLSELFLKIFGKGNEDMINFITPRILEDFEQTTQIFLKKQAIKMVSEKIYDALIAGTGRRILIIKKVMEETPFNYHFRLITDFHKGKCEKQEDHLFYFVGKDFDVYEGGSSYYKCLYCATAAEHNKRSQLIGNFVRCAEYEPHKKFIEGQKLLLKLVEKNSTEEEIEKFAELIIDLAI